MSKSQQKNKEEDDVYQWINELQQNPQNESLKEKLVFKYRNLVHSLASKYSRNRDNHEDLVQVGMIGLLVAAERFDPEIGKSFEAFLIPTIIGEIKRFIRDKTWSVHVPRRVKELGPRINRTVDELTNALQRSPTVTEIAEQLNVSEEEILETMEMGSSYRALSVDQRINADPEGSTISLLDLIGDVEEGYASIDRNLLLERILPILPKREQEILKYTFLENLSQKETGELLGISQMHVSRLQRRSLKKLREAIEVEM